MKSQDEPGKYAVDRLPSVTARIRQIVERAKELGIATEIFDALESIVSKLETEPLEWGDPEYKTKQQNGLVLHGLHFPLLVRYVTFEKQRVVCILRVSIFPRHPLEQ